MLRAVVVGSTIVLIATLPTAVVAGPGSPTPERAAPVATSAVSVRTHPVPVADTAARSQGFAAVLAPTRLADFALVGVTWAGDSAPARTSVEVRLHDQQGWSRWQQLTWEPSEGPAAGLESARDGTGPLWAGAADGVAVRVATGGAAGPDDVEVVTVDAARGPVALPRPKSGSPITGPTDFPNLPRVITRKQWGANPALTEPCDSPRYGSTAKVAFVHHTVNDNDYSVRESPAIVRAIYAYHTQGQGWCDIGYNALVDRFGNIYEGRRGGIRRPVRGAHAGDYNTGAVGVSLIGNFETRRPPARMKNALVRFLGWRLGTSYHPVRGRVMLNGASFHRIAGHRDAMSTACPGRYAYAALPRIRERVADYLSRYDSRLADRADALGQGVTGAVWKGERAADGGFRTIFGKGRLYGLRGQKAHWLTGRALQRYLGSGGVDGVLGWPKSDLVNAPIDGVRVLIAQSGRMYVHDNARRIVHGRIFQRYDRLGLATGRLGLPLTNHRGTDHGQRVDFQHGTIWWNEVSDKTRVRFT